MPTKWTVAITYDSEALMGFETGWGFSALLSSKDFKLLFDCGWDGHLLKRNLGRLGVLFSQLDMIVLSHDHWDHISGLTEILSEPMPATKLQVVVPSGFSQRLKKEISKRAILTETDRLCEIAPGVFSTGPLGSDIKEQSLVAELDGKSLIITGCAHPGLRAVTERASEVAHPGWMVGGFHGAHVQDIPNDIERVIPCHCTVAKKAILESFKERAFEGLAGRVFEVAPR